jgi:peptide-methionine (R)-S-oxide reductase
MKEISKRAFLGGAGLTALGAFLALGGGGAEAPAEAFEINLSAAEWRRRLGPERYHILREQGTERAFSSPLLNEHRRGTFACAGCGAPVFRSADKYESGTGWPSFTRAIAANVATRRDTSLFMERVEAHCRRCGGHLGHVFDDGPPPTHKRWCIDGLALRFAPARA